MYCKNCGQNLPEDTKFCNGCGARIKAEQNTPPPAPNPPQPWVCQNCGQPIPQTAQFCNNCGQSVSSEQLKQDKTGFTAPRPFQPYSSIDPNQGMVNKTVFKGRQVKTGSSGTISFGGGRNSGKSGKKSRLPRAIILIALLVLVSIIIVMCSGIFSHPKLKLGKTTDETSLTISGSGGVVSVNDAGSSINGFTITVSPGTYDEDTSFDVSTTEIKDHTYGDEFTPVTPMITVDNGHEFADRPMQVTIPISIADNEFAMGFFYDQKTGELEAIPFVDISSESITLLTNHFSNIVVSKILISKLDKLTSGSTTDTDSGFEPGVDDWQFVNYGSALAPGGHCAGQSLTMSWYYQQKHIGENEPSLYGLFDNNGDTKTESFWQDDSESYRFASVVQYYIDWDSLEFNSYLDFSRKDQTKVFYAFAYAIMMTADPQFMGIYHYDAYGNIAGGHAIVAYKVEGNRIYVADPNYPGQTDRYCELGSDGFLPYSSGANAADISANGAVLYTEMNFVAASALIDFDLIAGSYDMMLDGSVGDAEFPASLVETMTNYSSSLLDMTWSSDANITLGKDFVDSLPAEMKESTIVKITPLSDYLVYSLYMNGSTTAVQEPIFEVFEGSIYFELDLKNGDNTVAFLVEQEIGSYYSYVDFIEITINYSGKKEAVTTKAPKSSGTVKVICAFDNNYNYNPDIVTKECKAGDPFPYDFVEARLYVYASYKFGGYYTDKECTKPLNYTTVPNEDVYIYVKFIKITLNESLGKYEDTKLENYLEYNHWEFLDGGIVKHYYKYKETQELYVSNGTWTYREGEYHGYTSIIFDVNMESSSFPMMFTVYDGYVREGGGKEYTRIN